MFKAEKTSPAQVFCICFFFDDYSLIFEVIVLGGNNESPRGRGNSRKSQNHDEDAYTSEQSSFQHPEGYFQSANSSVSHGVRSVFPENIHAHDAFPPIGMPMPLPQLQPRPGFQLVAVPIVDHNDYSPYSSPIYDINRHRMDAPHPILHHHQQYPIVQAPYAPHDAPSAQLQAPHTLYMQQSRQHFFPPGVLLSYMNYAPRGSPHFYRGPCEGMIQTNVNMNVFPIDAGLNYSMENNSNGINPDVSYGFSYDNMSNCSLKRDK